MACRRWSSSSRSATANRCRAAAKSGLAWYSLAARPREDITSSQECSTGSSSGMPTPPSWGSSTDRVASTGATLSSSARTSSTASATLAASTCLAVAGTRSRPPSSSRTPWPSARASTCMDWLSSAATTPTRMPPCSRSTSRPTSAKRRSSEFRRPSMAISSALRTSRFLSASTRRVRHMRHWLATLRSTRSVHRSTTIGFA
mmetsp:Transcript_47575/g.151862  ORF Transcript_47575/g.151862 Transcript_47575/m.151862 type:complete len:202 (+) Transcript_47575:261-866(+)